MTTGTSTRDSSLCGHTKTTSGTVWTCINPTGQCFTLPNGQTAHHMRVDEVATQRLRHAQRSSEGLG